MESASGQAKMHSMDHRTIETLFNTIGASPE
jgi:hemerythrin superfamily protein